MKKEHSNPVPAEIQAELVAQYQIAHDRVVAEMQIEQLEPLTTEDELLSAAVNLTKRK